MKSAKKNSVGSWGIFVVGGSEGEVRLKVRPCVGVLVPPDPEIVTYLIVHDCVMGYTKLAPAVGPITLHELAVT